MRFVLNLIWLIFGGLWLAFGYAVVALIMCLLIITIPFGIASFRLAAFSLWPFGRTVISKPSAGLGSLIGNILWFILAGLWIAIGHLITSVVLAITIIGIPFAWQHLKLAGMALWPIGTEIVPYAVADAAYRRY